jgi:predicted DNA-binding protein
VSEGEKASEEEKGESEGGARGPGRPRKSAREALKFCGVRLKPELVESVDDLARRLGVTRSEYMRGAIERRVSHEMDEEVTVSREEFRGALDVLSELRVMLAALERRGAQVAEVDAEAKKVLERLRGARVVRDEDADPREA